MSKNSSSSRTNSCYALVVAKRILISLLVTSALVSNSGVAVGQASSPRETGAIGKIKFSIPAGFQLQPPRDSDVAIMKANTYEGGLFIATLERSTPSENDLLGISGYLVAEFFPQQTGFSWKVLPKTSIPKLSVHQRNQFVVKAVNENKFVQAEFVLLRLQKKNFLVGLVTRFGSERESRFLYEVDGTEYSFQGWRGLSELLDSIKAE